MGIQEAVHEIDHLVSFQVEGGEKDHLKANYFVDFAHGTTIPSSSKAESSHLEKGFHRSMDHL